MKSTLIFTVLLALVTSFGYGQSDSTVRKNDIAIDPLFLIGGPILNVSYERLLNSDFGVGLNVLAGLGNHELAGTLQFSPNVRMYFGEKYASGFFLEGFVPFTKFNYQDDFYDDNGRFVRKDEVNGTAVGLGVGLGGKWALKRHVVFELSGGIARHLFHQKAKGTVTGKGMLGVGYRF